MLPQCIIPSCLVERPLVITNLSHFCDLAENNKGWHNTPTHIRLIQAFSQDMSPEFVVLVPTNENWLAFCYIEKVTEDIAPDVRHLGIKNEK